METHKVRRPTFQLFDLLGKYIYQQASPIGTQSSLRGIFKTAAPPSDIQLVLGRTESVRKISGLTRIQGDLLFEGASRIEDPRDFLMEFQIANDRRMAVRVLNYGYAYAQRKSGEACITLPEAAVVYVGQPPFPAERLRVETRFRETRFVYEIAVYAVLAHTIEEMERDGLYLLMPFQLLKSRKAYAAVKTSEARRTELAQEALKTAGRIGVCLDRGCQEGRITAEDGALLLDALETVYNEIYQEGGMDFAEQLKKHGVYLKYPVWKAQFQAEKEAVIRRTAQERDAKILGLFRQGKSVEEVEALLAQETEPSLPQPAEKNVYKPLP